LKISICKNIRLAHNNNNLELNYSKKSYYIYMKLFDFYIYLIFVVKIGFILMAATHIYLKFKGKEKSSLDKKMEYWKERLEFIFVFLMAILLIYLFNPRNDRTQVIDKETKLLLYLFGFVLLITAKWNVFFHESKWLKTFTNIIGNKN
jgi:uncharacterized BrkB/YihY/UPF0761 family membrane protein